PSNTQRGARRVTGPSSTGRRLHSRRCVELRDGRVRCARCAYSCTASTSPHPRLCASTCGAATGVGQSMITGPRRKGIANPLDEFAGSSTITVTRTSGAYPTTPATESRTASSRSAISRVQRSACAGKWMSKWRVLMVRHSSSGLTAAWAPSRSPGAAIAVAAVSTRPSANEMRALCSRMVVRHANFMTRHGAVDAKVPGPVTFDGKRKRRSGACLLLLAPAPDSIQQPRTGDNEQRRKKAGEKKLNPDQSYVVGAHAESSPNRTKNGLRFQARSLEYGSVVKIRNASEWVKCTCSANER